MKRNRVKAAGLGLALWAGYLHGADPRPAGAPPSTLPSAVRAPDWQPGPVLPSDTVWLPARPANAPATPAPSTPPATVVPANRTEPAKPATADPKVEVLPPVAPGPGVLPVPEIPIPAAPSTPPATLPTLPELPVPESTAPIPATPATVLPSEVTPAPLPVLPTVAPSAPVVLPEIPVTTHAEQPDPLPKPRTAPPPIPPAKDPEPGAVKPVERELPTAPPEFMVPAGVPVPGRHGTFGSTGVQISKDYPSVRDLFDHDLGGWWGSRSTSDVPASSAMDRLEFRAEYLLWWMNSQKIPVLASTSSNGGLGFLGDPGTQTLLGPGSFGNSLRSGFRARAGYWFDECGGCGIDGSFFFLGRQSTSAVFDSANYPTLTRPIFAPNFPGEFGEIVALPGISSGVLTIDSTSQIWGFDLNLRKALCRTCDFRSEVFAGYRALALNESLTINEYITALPGNPNDPPGTIVTVTDRFETRNRFNGGQVGYAAERNWNRWSVDGRGSIALGNTSQTVEISGSQARLRPGMAAPDVFVGGLLAAGPNLGKFERNRFSVVPEFSLNLGYWVTPVIKAYVGYNFLYWTNVVRAGDQIDRVVDVTFVPNPPPGVPFSGQYRPQPTFQQSNLVLNGIQFGLMGRW